MAVRIIAESGTYQICATVDENQIATLTAPAGSRFTSVEFASYGTPTGTCGSFSIGACHQANSLSIVQGYLIGNSGSINIPATNDVFGEPCSGTFKALYIQATATKDERVTATASTTITATTALDAIGTGQIWTSFTAARSTGVTYTNNTGKPIMISVQVIGSSTITVGGVVAASSGVGDAVNHLHAIVPNGSTYIVAGSESRWSELRG